MSVNEVRPDEQKQESLLALSDARALLDIVYLINAILKSGGNLSRSAQELEIGRRTLYDLMEKYGISHTDGELSIKLTPLLSHVEFQVRCLQHYLPGSNTR